MKAPGAGGYPPQLSAPGLTSVTGPGFPPRAGAPEEGGLMAASTLYTIPVMLFFLFVQRRMVGGLVAGAVKG